MDKKRWLAFFLVFFLAYFFFLMRQKARIDYQRSLAPEAGTVEQVDAPGPSVDVADDRTPPELRPSTGPSETPEAPPAGQVRIEDAPTVVIETNLSRVEFSALGAVPVSWEILPSEFVAAARTADGSSTKTIELIPQVFAQGRDYPLQFEGRTVRRFNSAVFTCERIEEGDGVTFLRFTSPVVDDVQLVKTYRFEPDSYVVRLEAEVINGESRTPVGEPGYGWGIGWQGGFSQPTPADRVAGRIMAAASVDGELKLKALKDSSDPVRYDRNIAWAGQERKYFAAVIAPDPSNPAQAVEVAVQQRNITMEYEQKGVAPPLSVILEHPARDLTPRERMTAAWTLFVGPKDYGVLDTVQVPMISGGLPVSSIAFGQMPLGQGWIRPISLFLLKALRWFDSWCGNWGWAIILLVLVVKIILYPLSHWAIKNQAKTMAEQARIKPHLDEINRKYKDNPQTRSQEMMKLYREHNINPLGAMRGCFPILLQMPIFFALYILLDQAVELRGQSFLWIADLSQPDRLLGFGGWKVPLLGWDALNILPILMAVSQFYTSRLMTVNIQDPMQKQMMYMMPIMFGFLLYNMPSGLMLYWTVQNVWQIGHTVLTKRHVAHEVPAPKPSGAAA